MTRFSKHMKVKRGKPRNWCYVYALREKNSTMIRYIGQTQINPKRRLRFHLRDARIGKRPSPVHRWLLDCFNRKIIVVIEIIDKDGRLDTSEAVWIDRYLSAGHDLLNVLSVVKDRTAVPNMRRDG